MVCRIIGYENRRILIYKMDEKGCLIYLQNYLIHLWKDPLFLIDKIRQDKR